MTPESHKKVMRMKEMMPNKRSFWSVNKFSLTAPKEMYKEQYGEYALWLKGFKGLPAQRNVNRWEFCKVSSTSLLVPDSPSKPLPDFSQIF